MVFEIFYPDKTTVRVKDTDNTNRSRIEKQKECIDTIVINLFTLVLFE
jgi:hypothetical protein